jgi:hypothetical protein
MVQRSYGYGDATTTTAPFTDHSFGDDASSSDNAIGGDADTDDDSLNRLEYLRQLLRRGSDDDSTDADDDDESICGSGNSSNSSNSSGYDDGYDDDDYHDACTVECKAECTESHNCDTCSASVNCSGSKMMCPPEILNKQVVAILWNDNYLAKLHRYTFRYRGRFTPAGLAYLTRLRKLDLRSNKLGTVTMEQGIFDGLTALQELYLTNNALGTMEVADNLFEGLTGLKRVDLSENSISFLPGGLFDGLTALQELHLANNALGTMGIANNLFEGLTGLKSVDLSENGISFLPGGLFPASVEKIELHSNTLQCVNRAVLANLTRLVELDLRSNPFLAADLTVDHFTDLLALKTLHLQDDELEIDCLQYDIALDDRALQSLTGIHDRSDCASGYCAPDTFLFDGMMADPKCICNNKNGFFLSDDGDSCVKEGGFAPRFIPHLAEPHRKYQHLSGRASLYIEPDSEDVGHQSTTTIYKVQVNQPFRIAALALNDSTIVNAGGDFNDITFKLDELAHDSLMFSGRSGEISGFITKPDDYEASVIAVDAVGERAVVENMTISVVEFKVLSYRHYLPDGIDSARYAFSNATDAQNNDLPRSPFGGRFLANRLYFDNYDLSSTSSYQTLYAEVPVLLPPIEILHSANEFGNITFAIDNAPPGFFVNADNGEVLAQPFFAAENELGEEVAYDTTIFAIDGATGARALIEAIRFTVISRDIAIATNGPNSKRCSHGQPVDGVQFDATFSCDCTQTAYTGDNCETKRECEPNQSLTDDGQCIEFILDTVHNERTQTGAKYTDPATVSYFAVGATYRIAPIQIASTTQPSVGSFAAADFRYIVHAEEDGALPANLVQNAASGEILIIIEAADADRTFNVITDVIDQAGALVELETMTLHVKYRDTDLNNPKFAANGPQTMTCKNGGLPVDKEDEFDGQYTCDCEALLTFTGSNCQTFFAPDCATNESVVEGACKVFILTTSPNRERSGSMYTEPHAAQIYAVGETYRFAPIEVVAEQTTPSVPGTLSYAVHGQGDAKLPEGLFINADTGDVQASFGPDDNEKVYLVVVEVVDQGGARVELDIIELMVRFRDTDPENPDFYLSGPNRKPCQNGGLLHDAAGGDFDGAYTCDCSEIPFFGENCEVRKAECTPTQSLVLGECNDFVVQVGKNRSAMQMDPAAVYTDPDTINRVGNFYTVDEVYRIAPLPLIEELSEYSTGSKADLTYRMKGAPPGFFLNPTTGELMGSFAPFEPVSGEKTFDILMEVVDAGKAVRPLETLTMVVRYQDTSIPVYGPNQQACAHGIAVDDGHLFDQKFACDCKNTQFVGALCTEVGPNNRTCGINGGIPVNEIDFDGTFTCNCEATDGMEGENCEIDPTIEANRIRAEEAERAKAEVELAKAEADLQAENAAASASEKLTTSKSVAGWSAGGVIFLLALVIVAVTYRQHLISLQPTDFKALFEEMLEKGAISAEFNKRRATKQGKNAVNLDNLIPREIPRQCIIKSEKIGEGAFGEVFKGVLDEHKHGGVPGYLVACKSVIDSTGEGAKDLLQEATIMAQVGFHYNLVSLIGVVTSGTPLVLIMALCEHGSLKSQLVNRALGSGKLAASPGSLPPKIDADIALEIALGMQHLAEHHLVHRDLAARNVLLDSALTSKVADFGLSRAFSEDKDHEYYKSTTGMMALRWTAPEAMTTLKFSIKTDVWAFGVVLLEIATDGETPMKELTNTEVMASMQSGYNTPQPNGCSDGFYAAMCKCWSLDPEERPSFLDLADLFNKEEFQNTLTTSVGVGSGALPQNSVAPPASKMLSGAGYVGYKMPEHAGANGAGGGDSATGAGSVVAPIAVKPNAHETITAGGYVMQGSANTKAGARLYAANPDNSETITAGGYVVKSSAGTNAGVGLYSMNPNAETVSTSAEETITTSGYVVKSNTSSSACAGVGMYAMNPSAATVLGPSGEENGNVSINEKGEKKKKEKEKEKKKKKKKKKKGEPMTAQSNRPNVSTAATLTIINPIFDEGEIVLGFGSSGESDNESNNGG